jgi:hypothetical protein
LSTVPYLYLDPIPPGPLRVQARAGLDEGDVRKFLVSAGNDYSLDMVNFNYGELKRRGLYEEALLVAWMICRVNNQRYPVDDLHRLWDLADRDVLRRLAPLPGPGPFVLYRGVAGNGKVRRVRGHSWTADRKKAQWFAERFRGLLANPMVYSATIGAELVYAYIPDRDEAEFVVNVPPKMRLKKVQHQKVKV